MTRNTRAVEMMMLMAACLGLLHGQQPASNSGAECFLKQVLASMSARDQQGLEQLAVTEEEFKQCVWPSIAPLLNNTTSSKYFQTYSTANKVGLSDRLGELGGQNYELVKTSFGAEKRQKGCRLLPNPTITVRSTGGAEKTFRLAAGVIEQGGKYKITSYYLAPARGIGK